MRAAIVQNAARIIADAGVRARGRQRQVLLSAPVATGGERANRERAAYDEGGVTERSRAWMSRFHHVLEAPNTRRGEAKWEALIRETVGRGGRVLDVGSGGGETARLALACGANYVLGIDISESSLAGALSTQLPGRLEFRVANAEEPLPDGPFDLVVGRAVLHHVDLRGLLDRIASTNLAPDGRMLWMEPLAHPLALAFHKLVRSAHTPDEFPLLPADLRWIRTRFPGSSVVPINLVSFPAGAVSSLLFRSADNRLMRSADAVDRALFRRSSLVPFARQGIIVIPNRAAYDA